MRGLNAPGIQNGMPLNSADGSVVRHTKSYTLTRRVADRHDTDHLPWDSAITEN